MVDEESLVGFVAGGGRVIAPPQLKPPHPPAQIRRQALIVD